MNDFFNAKDLLNTPHGVYTIYRLDRLVKDGLTNLDQLPFSIRVILESLLRQMDGKTITHEDLINLSKWAPHQANQLSMPFLPARVIMQDFTGVPAIVDLAAMRSAVHRLGGDPDKINPTIPVDLVIDHSVQVDFFATQDALRRNAELEFQRNRERYIFLNWGKMLLTISGLCRQLLVLSIKLIWNILLRWLHPKMKMGSGLLSRIR